MENKRGLSTIIVTLILVLLSIVLVGIVWTVISNVVNSTNKNIASGIQCQNSQVQINAASCTQSGSACNVTVQRISGSDTLGGIRLIFYDQSGTTTRVNDSYGDVQTSATKTIAASPGLANISKIDAEAFFNDSAGKPSACSPGPSYTGIKLI